MKVLIASVYFAEIQQCLPIFVESINALNPKPEKTVLFDLFGELWSEAMPLLKGLEVRRIGKKENLLQQFSEIRNSVLKEAEKENYDAVLFLQPNIFPPTDILSRLSNSGKEVIAPAFFKSLGGIPYSNALKNVGKSKPERVPFEELLPSGIKKAEAASLEAIFLRKGAFNKIEFKSPESPLQEMIGFAQQVKNLNEEIFVDSSTVCSKLSPMQLMSHYYFKAQDNAEKKAD